VAFLGVFSLVAFGALGALGGPAPKAAAQQVAVGSPLESQVKAAYILNFINLTEWPPAALGPASNPLRICVAGSDPFRTVLEQTVKGDSVQGHPLVVERVTRDGAATCQVLFVAASDASQTVELLRALGSAPVLTIGEADAFLKGGGVVRFVTDQGHVRFDVNRRTAEQHGLTLSSRLLRVARSVQ
jgi:YfiR/HmsC-like